MKIKLSKNFFNGVFLTVRQVQLSLDRSLLDDWGNLISFFSCRSYVGDLAEAFDSLISAYSDSDSGPGGSIFQNISTGSLIFGGYFMSVDEMIFLRQALLDFFALLQKSASHEEIVNLRLRFYGIEESMRKRIGREVSSFDAVEHFNQAAHLECKEIHDFVGADWIQEIEDRDTHRKTDRDTHK
jgi:hypothetical protein